jgi:hypothetical protein
MKLTLHTYALIRADLIFFMFADDGGLYCWGFGKACGSKDDNYIYPERKYIGSCRFTAVSGGSFHSVALSGR